MAAPAARSGGRRAGAHDAVAVADWSVLVEVVQISPRVLVALPVLVVGATAAVLVLAVKR